MRILVLQLARFGDIYQTWPALKALKRSYPEAELHLLVRARFSAATLGLSDVQVHTLPTSEILQPIYTEGDEAAALANLYCVIDPLLQSEFTHIFNLSFSPASSYLTDALAAPTTKVAGYTRHSDGFLSIPDDASAYFYAQVGIGRTNRYHLTDVFASVCGVDLTEADRIQAHSEIRQERVVVHLGASQPDKVYPLELWVEALSILSEIYDGEIVLVGSANEEAMAQAVSARIPSVRNLAGKTSLSELQELLAQSKLLIGADSAPVHMATLTATKVLNLSSSTVNFWETGPICDSSRVLYETDISKIQPGRVANEALAMLQGRGPQSPCYVRSQDRFVSHGCESEDFSWNLIQALYTGSEFPAVPTQATALAFQRLFELAELALAQLAQWNQESTRVQAALILGKVDEMLEQIPRFCPEVSPAVQWFQTQRLRLPPESPEQTLRSTCQLFEELLWVAAVYKSARGVDGEVRRAADLCQILAPRLRECEFAQAEFQALVATVHELARHSTKVADRSWSSVLQAMNDALERRDFIELADQLEFELKPQMETIAADMIS